MPPLTRLLLAYLGFRVAEFGVWIGLAAAAYTAGGVHEATAVMIAQLVPAALFAPSVGHHIRRHGATAVLRAGLAAQVVGMAWCAVGIGAATGGPGRLAAYAGAVVAAVAVTTTRPAVTCILPRLVADDAALARTNGRIGAIDGAGMLVGPAVAAVLLATSGAGPVFATMAVVVLAALALTGRLPQGVGRTRPDARTSVPTLRDEVRTVLASPSARVLTALLALVSLLIGALDLALVVTAVDQLGLSGSAAGWLNAAFGLGMVGGGLALGGVSRTRLGRWIIAGLGAWALALLTIAHSTSSWIAGVLLVGAGVGAAAAEVAGRTLLQRIAGLDQLAAAFSFVESTQMAALATGTLSVGVAVQIAGPRAALIAPGLLLLVATAVAARAVLRSEHHAHRPLVAVA